MALSGGFYCVHIWVVSTCTKVLEIAPYKMESICWLQVAKSANLLDNNLSIVVEGTDIKGDLSHEQEQ